MMTPTEDPDLDDLGPAFPAWAVPGRDAILQPPKPQLRPSEQILEHITAASQAWSQPTDHWGARHGRWRP